MMGCLNPFMFLTVLWLVHGTNGLTVSVTGPSVVQQGNNTEFTCTVNGGTATRFGWMDGSVKPPATIYSGGGRFSTNSKYSNFLLAPKTATTSVMTIKNTTVEDEGLYYCSIPQDDSGIINLSVQGTNVVTVSVTGPSVVQQGNNAVFTCTVNGGTVARLRWMDDSVASSLTIYSGGVRYSTNSKYSNFVLRPQETNTTSVMIIENATVEDEGLYYCSIPEDNSNIANLSVEVRSRRSLTLSSRVTNDEDTYIATCEATGGKPMESITWILNGETQSDGNGNITESTGPPATPPLSNTRSVFTFPATLDNYGQTLVCDIGGHTLTELNGQESTDLNIHTFPSAAGTTVSVAFETQGSDITVSCNASNEPMPSMRNYYIFSTNTLIHASTDGVDQFTVENPELGTSFTCLAGNYLGNTSLSDIVTYDPNRGHPLGTGNIVGIITAIVVVLCLTHNPLLSTTVTSGFSLLSTIVDRNHVQLEKGAQRERRSREKGGKRSNVQYQKAGDTSSEKDNIIPVPAPRDQGSIQRTTDNLGQAEFAMVDRKKPGGEDMPDTRGLDQKESPGMYADLDLSANAGKTERQVRLNPDDVVKYSTISV